MDVINIYLTLLATQGADISIPRNTYVKLS